jgi:hypothetical protein
VLALGLRFAAVLIKAFTFVLLTNFRSRCPTAGTNEGLLSMFRNRPADSASEQSELEGPSGDDEDYLQQHGGAADRPTSLTARLAEQEAYIANLEDENLR